MASAGAVVAMLLARAATNTGDLLMSLNDWIKDRYATPALEAAEAKGCAEERDEWQAW